MKGKKRRDRKENPRRGSNAIRTIRFVSVLLLVLTLTGFAEDKVVQSVLPAAEPMIDGTTLDWDGIPRMIEKKFGLEYALANSRDDLYILVVFNDPKYLSTLPRTGLKIWLNTQGKKSETIGVHFFEKTVDADEMIAKLEQLNGPIPEDKKAELRAKKSFLYFSGEFIDKKENPIETTPLKATIKPATFRSSKSPNAPVFELRIPLAVQEIWTGGLPDMTKPLMLGFEWGGTTKEMRAAMMRQRAQSASQVSQGATEFATNDDGSDTGPVVGDRNIPFQRNAKKYSFWIQVQLAQY